MFGHNPHLTREDYEEVVDSDIENGRLKAEDKEKGFGGFFFAELNTDENGDTSTWTKAQTYIAFGNALNTLAQLRIDSTPMEGIDAEMVNKEFEKELGGFHCDVALAIGYRLEEGDYNANLPKSRRKLESVLVRI